MKTVYGRNDIEHGETISLKIALKKAWSESRSDVVFLGKILCHASGRDSGGRVGEDVCYIKGEVESGGSVKNWYSYVTEGSQIVLNNVSKILYDEYMQSPFDWIEIEVLDNTTTVNKEELLKEKERLLRRLNEIEELLKE